MADINLGLAVPLYTGGELTRTATAAAAGVEAASRREDGVKLDLARSVRLAFTGALGRQAQVEASALAVARLSRHLESVTGAEQAGAATTESVVRAQTRLALARQRHLQAESARDSSALALGRLVGRPGVPVPPATRCLRKGRVRKWPPCPPRPGASGNWPPRRAAACARA